MALICGVAPLWASSALPLVDLPQHLHLISVLHRLDDASTLYPEIFARRPVLTPYLGYYYSVSFLSWLFPIELANRIFLSAYVVGLPLSLGFLLSTLKRPTWPALLAIPFAYGDSFAWGFLNFCTALPLAFLSCAFLVRAIESVEQRRAWSIALGVSLIFVLLFHVQVFAWLALAFPILLLMSVAPDDAASLASKFRARVPALVGMVPGVVMFLVWLGLRAGPPQEVAPGADWKAWGPMLSKENLSWRSPEENIASFMHLLADMVPDQSDQNAVKLAFAIAGVALAVGLLRALHDLKRRIAVIVALVATFLVYLASGSLRAQLMTAFQQDPRVAAGQTFVMLSVIAALLIFLFARQLESGRRPAFRIMAITAAAIALYFCLPFDIRGYMYYLNARYAHLIAALVVCCVPAMPERWNAQLAWLGVVVGLTTAQPLVKAFKTFDEEMAVVDRLAASAPKKPKVMGLIFNTASRASRLPVFLHASTVIARHNGGYTNFSFATTPHSPLMYKNGPPPTFPSEWRPNEMNWELQGKYYDTFLVRGVHPARLLGQQLQAGELELAAQEGDWFLVRKK